MRKIIWLILGLIAIVWLAIAAYWTGSEETSKSPVFPENPTITPTTIPTATLTPTASVSASPEPTTSVKIVSPTVSVNFKY